MPMVRVEQAPARDLVVSDAGRRTWSTVNAGWPVFAIAVAITLYSLGFIVLLAVAYLFPASAVQAWANHVYHTFYGMVLSAGLLIGAFIVFTYLTRVPFARPLLGLAFVQLITAYALMFILPDHHWVVWVLVCVGIRVWFGFVLRRGLFRGEM